MTKRGAPPAAATNHTLSTIADCPLGPFRIARIGEDLPLRQRLARLRVLCEMLNPEVGFQFLPTLSGVTQGREKPSLESTNRMRLGEEVPVQLLGIDLRQMSVGQQHVLILPSSSLFVFSRMANVALQPRRVTIAPSGVGCKRVLGRSIQPSSRTVASFCSLNRMMSS